AARCQDWCGTRRYPDRSQSLCATEPSQSCSGPTACSAVPEDSGLARAEDCPGEHGRRPAPPGRGAPPVGGRFLRRAEHRWRSSPFAPTSQEEMGGVAEATSGGRGFELLEPRLSLI